MKYHGALIMGLTLLPCISYADDAPQSSCSAAQASLSADQAKYKTAFDSDEQRGEQMKRDAVTLNVDVTWSDQTIAFGVPSVTINQQKIIFGVPQVTMKTQHIIFGTPSIKMVPTKTGQYPEFTCHDTWIQVGPIKTKGAPACTVKWSDIITNIPQTFMQQQDIQMGIPEFKWDDTQIIMGIPEFTMQQVKWIIGLPQFTLRSIAINSQKISDESSDIQSDVAEKKKNMVTDVGNDVHSMFSCYRKSISDQKDAVSTQSNVAVAQIDGSIQAIRTAGADPTNVKDSTGNATNLVAIRADLDAQRDKALSSFDDALKQLDDSEKTAVEKLSAS